MWYCVHIIEVVQCTCGIVYTLRKWFHVHVMLCTHCASGVVYRWYYVHDVHMVLVYMWYCVHLIHVVLREYDTMYVHCVFGVS